MRYWTSLLTLVCFAFSSPLGAVVLKKGPGSGGGGGVPGVSNGIATDATVQFTYSMPSFRGMPADLTPYYFSNASGGDFPTGSDSNPCTRDAPCLTVYKMAQIARAAYKPHIILDAGDAAWDLGDIADVGGPSFTGAVTFNDTAKTIEIDAGTAWGAGSVGFITTVGARIEVTGAATAANDRVYTVASWSGDTITVNETITGTDAADDVTIQQYYDQIRFTQGCGDGSRGSSEVCGAISGSDFSTRDPAEFTCANLSTSDPVERINSIQDANGFIVFYPDQEPESGWLFAQNLKFNECPKNNDSTGSGTQDILRTDGPGDGTGNVNMALLNIECTEIHGNNNQCFTTHGSTSDNITLNMGGTIAADQSDDAQLWWITAGSDSLFISDRRCDILLDNTSSTPTYQNMCLVLTGDANNVPVNSVIIGPTLSASGSGSSAAEAGLNITPSQAGDWNIYVAYTVFRDLDETTFGDSTDCSSAANQSHDECSGGIRVESASDSGAATNFNLYTYRNTFDNVGSAVFGGGLISPDSFYWKSRCDLIEDVTQTSGGDAYIVNFGNGWSTSGTSFDLDIQQTIKDENDGTGSFLLDNRSGTQTEYATRALAVAADAEAENLTAFFTDGGNTPVYGSTTYDSAGTSTDGNQFCSNVTITDCSTNKNQYDLEEQSACSWKAGTLDTAQPECIRACNETFFAPMPSYLIAISESVWGEEIRGWRLGKAGEDTNVGAR